MRIRSIKPELWTDGLTGEWGATLTLFFVGLWQVADDSGRLRLDPRLIRADLDPFDTKFGGTAGISKLTEELIRSGRVLVYEAEGQRLGLVKGFAVHQVINKPTKSRLPPPPEDLREASRNPPVAVPPKDGMEGSLELGSGSLEQGASCAESVASAPAPAPAVLSLPCVGAGPKTYAVTTAEMAGWREAFPGVDVLAELRKARAWLDANPTKRKTAKGAPRFIVSWLGRAQDNAGRPGSSTAAAARNGAPVPAASAEDFAGEKSEGVGS